MIEVKWKPWPYAAFKPNCLFCPKKAHEAACYADDMQSVAIRACESEECRKKATETCIAIASA